MEEVGDFSPSRVVPQKQIMTFVPVNLLEQGLFLYPKSKTDMKGEINYVKNSTQTVSHGGANAHKVV